MTDNQDTLGMKHVIDLSTVAATSAPSKFQQLIKPYSSYIGNPRATSNLAIPANLSI
jgi:hypothetical protein